jgi:D-galactarolactone cycloisomerase
MNRRYFLGALAATVATAGRAQISHTIKRITLAPVECRFHRFVAMNSYDTAPKGHTYANTLVRIITGEGAEGIGVMEYRAPDDAFLKAVRALIGVDPLALYERKGGRIIGRNPAYPVLKQYRHLDGPLFDLIGKLTSNPAWQLIGPSVRDRVEVYDGTLYFSDVWFPRVGVKACVEEAEEALKRGYRGVKLKMGRGSKWMEREAGTQRDIEVTKAVRRAVGKEMRVLVDANNGYKDYHDHLWRYISETAASNVGWFEEMFPQNVAHYTWLRERMDKAGIRTQIAEGENETEIAAFMPYLKPKKLYDVVQMDIRRGGFVDNAELARVAAEVGAQCVPHNWGSQLGGFMCLHLSRAVKTVPAAEDDRSVCDVVIADGYVFKDGYYTLVAGLFDDEDPDPLGHWGGSPGTLTIQPTPKRSVSIPKHGDQKVLPSGICTCPPSASAAKMRPASSSVGTPSESEKPPKLVPSWIPSEAISVLTPTRKVACMTLFSKPGGSMPGGGGSGLSL